MNKKRKLNGLNICIMSAFDGNCSLYPSGSVDLSLLVENTVENHYTNKRRNIGEISPIRKERRETDCRICTLM